MALETVKLTAGFKLDGLLPESLFSMYREIVNYLLDYAWAKGITSFKKTESREVQRVEDEISRLAFTLYLYCMPDGLLNI